MSELITTFNPIATTDNSLSGYIRVPSGTTATPTGITFYFTDGSYITSLTADIDGTIYFPILNSGVSDVVIFNLNTLQPFYSAGGAGEGDYFDASGQASDFTISTWVDGLYRYELGGTPNEIQWLLYISSIETKMVALAKQLLDSQCECSLDSDLSEKFVKAKAYQELIYNKVIGLSTDQVSVLQIQDTLSEVNEMVKTLTDFLNGSSTLCGC